MSANDQRKEPLQFDQSIPKKREPVDLDAQYKSIGISAVNAATSFKRKPIKGPRDQMS